MLPSIFLAVPNHWLDDQALDILSRMLTIASKKGAYFGMMLAISIAGLWSFFTGRGGRYGRLLFVTGFVLLGVSLGAVSYEGSRAVSFWRYNVQLYRGDRLIKMTLRCPLSISDRR